MRVWVTNRSESYISRGGQVFKPGEAQLVEVDGAKLRELRACRWLTVKDKRDRDVPIIKPGEPIITKERQLAPIQNICGCGFVAKSAGGLTLHKRRCELCS